VHRNAGLAGRRLIKVERQGSGDQRRQLLGRPARNGLLLLHAAECEQTQRDVHPQGAAWKIAGARTHRTWRRLYRELRTRGRLGFGYNEVARINPRIIYAQIKGFPTEGTYGQFLSFDMIAQVAGGAYSITGEQGGARHYRLGPGGVVHGDCAGEQLEAATLDLLRPLAERDAPQPPQGPPRSYGTARDHDNAAPTPR
jgi:crotonobetainyl-CoA:carnitine CoA-transferase CaiB-like acyl-CoA transferase